MAVPPVLLWFRQDLRLTDNAAFAAACARGGPVVPLFILDEDGEGDWTFGAASRSWLHHSLNALDATLRERGSQLVVLSGDSSKLLQQALKTTGADAVFWNRRYEPAVIKRDAKIKSELAAAGIDAKSFSSTLLFEPHSVANKQGQPFQVYSAFWRACMAMPLPEEVAAPRGPVQPPEKVPRSIGIDALKLQPKISWDREFYTVWTPGELGAKRRLKTFLSDAVQRYAEGRDEPSSDAISRLSAHLHFGEIGPRQIWSAVKKLSGESGVFPSSKGAAKFLSELGWREFAYHLLFHFPTTPEQPLRPEFARFPWAADPEGVKFEAWRRGRTGYPIVDAGMRQLWTLGWMHNRVRMIVASFLVKHLRLPWKLGADWFWDTLVDADLANNTLGWQWTAGCGADAAPYFRVFSPMLQGEKFDAEGSYVRRWVPELANVPSAFIHKPWDAPADVLLRAGVILGKTYPRPIVDHAKARDEALDAFKRLRSDPVPSSE